MSDTERDALESGTVWWEGELFRGRPDWDRLLSYPKPRLSAEEQAFLDNQVETACAMVDDWRAHHDGDLPAGVWECPPQEGFLA